ncbi:MAG: FHA domain-containing protein [Planctomycetes bacterium]|nr:FHA domain-containing protein [Planctomycetota bacterium]
MNTNPPEFHLVVVEGIHAGRVIPVTPPFLIGRAAKCHLRPASTAVSQVHCVIESRDGRVFIRDFGSTNGTFINSDRLLSDYELRDGDEVWVGPLRFRVLNDSPIRDVEEPVVAAMVVTGSSETIVNGELQAADETIVSDDRMTDDEAARLLLDDDEEADQEQEAIAAELPTPAMAAIEHAQPSDRPTSSAAGDILRRMRRTKK